MPEPLHLRRMTADDLGFADSLRALVGWNQTLPDWRRFLELEPHGCFIAEWNDAPAGTVTTTRYGADVAWIGMLLVHPDFRNRGLGKALLNHALAHLSEVRCVKLDATPLGKTLYDKMGFSSEWPLARWERKAEPSVPSAACLQHLQEAFQVRACQSSDWKAVEEIDALAFGVARGRVLRRLAGDGTHAAVICGSESAKVEGFGLLRPGSRACYLGPVVAASAEAGQVLAGALLSRAKDAAVFWDIPDLNVEATALAKGLGFVQQRPLVRMFRNTNARPGNPSHYFAIADPAVG